MTHDGDGTKRGALVVEAEVELVVLRDGLVGRHARAHLPRRLEQRRQVEARRLGVAQRLVHLEEVGAAHHLVDGAEAELGHDAAQLFGDVVEEVDDVLGLSRELGAKRRVLGGDADRAGVEVAPAERELSVLRSATCSSAKRGDSTSSSWCSPSRSAARWRSHTLLRRAGSQLRRRGLCGSVRRSGG